LKMAPFDRPYATFYWSAIVNIALSCTIFELFDVIIVRPSVCLSVRNVPVSDENGLTYRHSFFTIR